MEVHNPVGFWNRLGARIIDGILMGIVTGIISAILFGEFANDDYNPLDGIGLLYSILLPLFWYGYTVGKRATGVRIVKKNGENVGIGNMLMRELVSIFVYALTLGIGLIVSAFMVGLRHDKRAIHDFIGGTYVTYDPPEKNEYAEY
ncbi:RDD family protein [Thalassobacillus devorans]|uniref:RDD family protein n=1 Tax=Thalassobacillus devorans TaxID=279813 RepID=UPI000A1CD9DF|nr:RDD family protein [Thalassobacillus devorans]